MNFRLLFCIAFFALSGCKTLSLSDSDQNIGDQPTPEQIQAQQQELVQQQAKEEERAALHDECLSELSDNIDPQAYANLWDRVQNQLNFDIPDNRRVRAQKSWYSMHPSYMKRVTKRATPYLFNIVEELENNNLPLELALLPIVESAFEPWAYSHGRAAGLWQFIPGTAKNFGLQLNDWYDGRRDVYHSTKAAMKFLTYLHKRFDGNWLYALAAYNSGEGNVRRAIRRNKKSGKPVDFWSLKLPKETKAYVPKLLALAEMLSERTSENSLWTPIDNLPYYDLVSTESQIDIYLAKELAEISIEDFYALNPAFNKWATGPKGPHSILLPIDKIETFKTNLKQIPKSQRISFKSYKIKSGDSLIKIAKKFDTTVALLRQHNSIRGNAIRAGKSLLIPVPSEARDKYLKSASQRLLASHNAKRAGQKLTFKVKPGDSFWDLSRKYKVNIRRLAKWNNMAPTDPLKVGQKLVVWTKEPQMKLASLENSSKKKRKIYYKVRNGDSFSRVASKFRVSLNDIKKWNKSKLKKKYLKPGDSLTLWVDITRQY